jgi:hypothetical protein
VIDLSDINFKLESPGADINYVGSVPYYFRSGTIYVDGKQITSPTRSATTVEYNANSKLKEIVKISSDVSIVDKTLKETELRKLLRGTNGYVSLNASVDRHMSKMKYSPLHGFIVRPQNKAKHVLASRKEEYERIYDYSAMIASNTGAKFWGLTFPHFIPIEDIKDLWQRYVIDRESNAPYPMIFLDPSDEDFTAFQYVTPFLKSSVSSGHIPAIGLHYSSPVKMQPILRDLIRVFKDLDVAIITTGIERESRYKSLSGPHGQEIFMSDVVALGSGRMPPPKQNGNGDIITKKEQVIKAFEGNVLTISHLKAILGDKERIEGLLESIRSLRSTELKELILTIVQTYTIKEILEDEEMSETLSYALKLHELERSGDEIHFSKKFAQQGEVREYVREVKPTLGEWLNYIRTR